MVPLWRNFFENTATVQFQHRVLAITTLAGVGAMYVRTMASQSAAVCWAGTPRYTRMAMHAVAAMSVAQVTIVYIEYRGILSNMVHVQSTIKVGLGISTLLLYVPIPLAALHQVRVATTCIIIYCYHVIFKSFLGRISHITYIAHMSGAFPTIRISIAIPCCDK